jgi:hypothetical protein
MTPDDGKIPLSPRCCTSHACVHGGGGISAPFRALAPASTANSVPRPRTAGAATTSWPGSLWLRARGGGPAPARCWSPRRTTPGDRDHRNPGVTSGDWVTPTAWKPPGDLGANRSSLRGAAPSGAPTGRPRLARLRLHRASTATIAIAWGRWSAPTPRQRGLVALYVGSPRHTSET